MNIVNFDVKFQSNSVNDGQVIAARIYTTFLPIKTMCSVRIMYSMSFKLWHVLSSLYDRGSLP